MASLDSYKQFNPTVQIMNIQRSKISECIRKINDDIEDTEQNCTHINELMSQLEQLCQLHFMYEMQLLEEISFPSLAEQKLLFESLLKDIESIKVKNDQCHTPSFYEDFIRLRLDFVFNMNNETRILCDYLTNNAAEPH